MLLEDNRYKESITSSTYQRVNHSSRAFQRVQCVSDDDPYPMAWFGDLLCVASSFLYAVSNITQESWVRSSAGPPRFLGRLGVCGAVLSCVQALIFERHALFSSRSGQVPLWRNGPGLLAWGAYTCALSAAYALTSWFLVGADAALFNLSLLTADVYAVLFAWFAEGVAVSPLYGVAFACTMAGLTVYHRAPAATSTASRAAAAEAQANAEAEAETADNTESKLGGHVLEYLGSDTVSMLHSGHSGGAE
jgi:solute carrier family 35 protein F1/2